MSVRRSIFRALCLATVLGLGIQIVYAVVVCWLGAVAYEMIPSRSPAEYLGFLADGRPVIITYTPTEYYSQSARSLDGKPIAREELENTVGGASLPGTRPPKAIRRGWSGRIQAFSDAREPAVYWYFIHTGERNGYGYFAGYDSKLKLRVGHIGAGGFQRDKPPPEEWFPVDGRRVTSGSHITSSVPSYYSFGEPRHSYYVAQHEPMQTWMVYLVSNDRILEIDLRRRSVRTLMDSDEIVSIAVSERIFPAPKKDELVRRIHRQRYLAVRLRDRVEVIDPFGPERRTYLLPERLRHGVLSLYDWSDGPAVMEAYPLPARSPVDLYWIADSEQLVGSERTDIGEAAQIEPVDFRTVHVTTPRQIDDPRLISAGASLVSPVPAGWAVASTIVIPAEKLRSGKAAGYPAALAKSLADVWPGIVISVALSAVAVWLCVRRQRQYSAPWTRTWAVFVFLFGFPGLLGYLFCRRWPPLEDCPACSHEAPRDRESCAACGADFPEPAPKGIEVFA